MSFFDGRRDCSGDTPLGTGFYISSAGSSVYDFADTIRPPSPYYFVCCIEDFGSNRPDICFGCSMIHHACTQGELPMDGRVGDIDLSTLNNLGQNRTVQVVKAGIGMNVAEADRAQLD